MEQLISNWGFISKKNKLLIAHGNDLLEIKNDSLIKKKVDQNNLTGPFRLLLSKPYLYTFTQETIHLKKRSLSSVDRSTIPVGHFEPFSRTICSIHISDKKAITIHSYLTNLGNQLMTELRKKKYKFRIHPALEYIIHNFVGYQLSKEYKDYEGIRVYFNEEIIHIDWQLNTLRFVHLNYFHKQHDPLQNVVFADNTIQKKVSSNRLSKLILFDQRKSKISDEHLRLLFPEGKKKIDKINRITIQGSKRRLPRLNLNTVLAVFLVLISLGAVFSQILLYHKKGEKNQKQKAVTQMLDKTEKFKEISRIYRSYFDQKALVETTSKLKINPVAILNKIEVRLPSNTWILKIQISYTKIHLQILEYGSSQISPLQESLRTSFSNIELTSSKIIAIEGKKFTRHNLIMKHRQSGKHK